MPQATHHSTNQWKHGPPIAACTQQPRSDNRCYTTRWQLSIFKPLFAVSSGHLTLCKIVVNFIKSNSRLLGGISNSSLEDHCKRMEKPGTFGTQAELQAASSLLQVPVYIFLKPNEPRDWEWMVYNPQSKSQLDFSVCPGLAALQPSNST